MLTHQKNRVRIRNYETSCFYTHRITCSHCDDCTFCGCIGTCATEFQTTSQISSMQLKYKTAACWLDDVRNGKRNFPPRFR